MENRSRVGHGLPDGELEALRPLQRQRSGGGQGWQLRWVLRAVRRRIFTARLVCMFAMALLGLAGGAGNAFAQATTTVVASQNNPSVIDQTVTLIATVSVTTAFVPGGSVQFFDGATPLGSSLSAPAARYLPSQR